VNLYGVKIGGNWVEIRESESRPKLTISKAKTQLGNWVNGNYGLKKLDGRKEGFITLRTVQGGEPIGVIKRSKINADWLYSGEGISSSRSKVFQLKDSLADSVREALQKHGFAYYA
jgi:hypothetical protein